MPLLLKDDFTDRRGRGRVLGPAARDRPARLGRDVERVLSLDGGALRIQPPLREGWGRTCLAYGPYPARPGLTLAVLALNGHNTSQSEVMADTLRSRLERWARGSGTLPVRARLWNWLRSGRVRRVGRQARWWARIAVGATGVQRIDENLAVGFYPRAVVDPTREGVGFVMHATGPENGELRAGAGGRWAPVARGVQNLPIGYVVRLRQRDALCLAAGTPGARGLGDWPALRPLAVTALPAGDELYAAVHQCLLGQIGFRADTRVSGVRVAQLDAGGAGDRWAWAHAAAAADEGTLPPAAGASVGGAWVAAGDAAWLRPAAPSGLVRARLRPSALTTTLGLRWRGDAAGDGWELALGREGLALRVRDGAGVRDLAAAAWPAPGQAPPIVAHAAGASAADAGAVEVQVLDDGREVVVLVDGASVFGRGYHDTAGAQASGVGLAGAAGAAGALEAWEALPREVPLPVEFDLEAPWTAAGARVVAADPLDGPAGDLEGRVTPTGGRAWRRILGPGRLVLDGRTGARWDATAERPLAGRTIYALDWDAPELADLSVTLTPPGTARGQREHGTAGFCLWQDEDNYLLVNTWLDDGYGGASLSSFLNLDGFEDLYDAIWTNVGDRVVWGRPLRLRLVCDGRRFLVSLDGEPVLYRALADVYPGRRPLRITRVGLLGNWEWGADTGSRFASFEARA